MCMKRTNLVLDATLLQEAVQITGEKTYSATVNYALREIVRQARASSIFDLMGKDLWEGDLSEIRRDRFPPATTKPKRRKRR